MSNKRDKSVIDGVDGEYCSQPAPKSSKWLMPKWRRGYKSVGESSESAPNEQLSVQEDQPEASPQNAATERKWIFPHEDSKKWSDNVVDFYNSGDAPFCYSKFFNLTKLDYDFWGTLLGYRGNGGLWPMHIEGWVKRMMHYRVHQLGKNGPSKVRWSILPPQFAHDLTFYDAKITAKYGNGSDELYPPFWEVDYIYIPLHIQSIEDWLLVRINMRTLEMTQYWSNHRYEKEYSRLLFHPHFDNFQIYFGWLLDELHYWRRYNGPYTQKRIMTYNANEDYLPKEGGDLGGDSGVLVCMLMKSLTDRKQLVMGTDFKEKCVAFRRSMADQFYNSRFGI